MPDKIMPGPVGDSCGVREAVCIPTRKMCIRDSKNGEVGEDDLCKTSKARRAVILWRGGT